MSSLYFDLAQELVTAIEEHPFFSGLDDDKMEAVFEEDASFLKNLELKVNRRGGPGSTVSIAFEGSRNNAPGNAGALDRTVRYTVTLWTRMVLRQGQDRPAYELIEALERLLNGRVSEAAAPLHLRDAKQYRWRFIESGVVPDPKLSRWEISLSINTLTI